MPITIPVKSEMGETDIPHSQQKDSDRLKITEIFYSLQGESNTSGWPTVFIRLTGCPLRCQYCDTAYAFTGGQWQSSQEIIDKVQEHKVQHITVTGGEPLAQKNCIGLLSKLCDLGYTVSLETSGAFSVEDVDPRVIKVVDIKTPASAEVEKNDYSNFARLSKDDQIKFVICNREDFDWAVKLLDEHQLHTICTVLFSPSKGQLDARELAEWILEQELPVRYQIQLHKILWGDKQGV